MPHHHLHISGFACFLIVLLILGILGLVFWFITALRRPKLVDLGTHTHDSLSARPTFMHPDLGGQYNTAPPFMQNPRYTAAQPAYQPPPPAYYPAPQSGFGGNGFFEGMIIGDMMGGGFGNRGGNTTIIEQGGGNVVQDAGGTAGGWGNTGDDGISYTDNDTSPVGSDDGGVSIDW